MVSSLRRPSQASVPASPSRERRRSTLRFAGPDDEQAAHPGTHSATAWSLSRRPGSTDNALDVVRELEATVQSVESLNDNVHQDVFVTQRGGNITESLAIQEDIQLSNKLTQSSSTMQSTALLRKRRELKQVQGRLENKRLEFQKRMQECREKQEELRAKQKQLRERVQKFEKFLRENDAKRQRALAKALTERKLKELKEQELSSIQGQLNEEIAKHEHILHINELYTRFEAYLNLVVASLPSDYLDVHEPHINDILMRHHTLDETNRDLMRTLQRQTDEIESLTNHLNDIMKIKSDRILVYNSQLGALQKKLDKVKAESAKMESVVGEAIKTGKTRMLVLSETKLAINNIFQRVSSNTHGPTDSSSLTEKLTAIQDRILDMAHITSKVEVLMRDERDRQRVRAKTGDRLHGAGHASAIKDLDGGSATAILGTTAGASTSINSAGNTTTATLGGSSSGRGLNVKAQGLHGVSEGGNGSPISPRINVLLSSRGRTSSPLDIKSRSVK